MQPAENTLTLRVQADDEENLRRIQEGIATRLTTIGRRDRLTVTWHRAAATPETPPANDADTAPPSDQDEPIRRGHGKAIAFSAMAIVAIAVHLGLGAAVLAASPGTLGTVGVILTVVLVKVTAVGFVLRRRRRRTAPVSPTTSHGP